MPQARSAQPVNTIKPPTSCSTLARLESAVGPPWEVPAMASPIAVNTAPIASTRRELK